MVETNLNKIDIGKLAKPIDTLIKKVASAIGMIYEPTHIKRIAMAEGEAEKIKALSRIETQKLYAASEVEIKEIQQRALIRFVHEETQKQINMDQILEKSFKDLNEKADAEKIENDWIANFFDKAKLISDDEMQKLWAKVLAGEANQANTYSKRTINFLSTLDKIDAELFEKLCSYSWIIAGLKPTPLIFNVHDSIYTNNSITYSNLMHLDEIGLITFQSISGFKKINLTKQTFMCYQDEVLILEFDNSRKNEISIGTVLLTKIGEELFNLSNIVPIEGFKEHVYKQLMSQNIKFFSVIPEDGKPYEIKI